MSDREAMWRRAAPTLAAWFIRAVGATMRLQTVHREAIEERWRSGEPSIIAFWHGRQLMMPLTYGGRGLDILISQHRDGELISRAMRSFGFESVRGSTTRGGAAALKTLIAKGRAGRDLAVTPDGPKGPRRVAQLGVIHLARATRLPIFPLAFGASKKKVSRVGTDSSCRARSREGCFVGATRSRCGVTPTRPSARRVGRIWSGR